MLQLRPGAAILKKKKKKKMEEEDHGPKNTGSSRSWEKQGNHHLLEVPKGLQSIQHIDFRPMRHVLAF